MQGYGQVQLWLAKDRIRERIEEASRARLARRYRRSVAPTVGRQLDYSRSVSDWRPNPSPLSHAQPDLEIRQRTGGNNRWQPLTTRSRAKRATLSGPRGRSIDAWVALVKASGKERHTDILAWLKAEHGFSHGNANFVALTARRGSPEGGGAELVDAMYAGPKATLRPFHDQVIELTRGFGDDVELAPKQAYVSLRRSKQFGTVGPGPGGRLEIGLNLAGVEPAGRLEATAGMCTHRVRLSSHRRARRRGHRLAPGGVRASLDGHPRVRS